MKIGSWMKYDDVIGRVAADVWSVCDTEALLRRTEDSIHNLLRIQVKEIHEVIENNIQVEGFEMV